MQAACCCVRSTELLALFWGFGISVFGADGVLVMQGLHWVRKRHACWRKLCCWRTYTQSTMIYDLEMRPPSLFFCTSLYICNKEVLAPCLFFCRLLRDINVESPSEICSELKSQEDLDSKSLTLPFSWSLPTEPWAGITGNHVPVNERAGIAGQRASRADTWR